MKKFLCVKFNIKGKTSTDIVCQAWMSGENFCYWPPKKIKEKIEKMVKRGMLPNESWKKYKCEIVCESSKCNCEFWHVAICSTRYIFFFVQWFCL